MNNNITTESGTDDNGQVRVGVILTQEQVESLRALMKSPHWKTYRAVLIKLKEEHFHATLAYDDPNKILKQMGLVAGLNLAINQAPVLIQHLDDKRKKQETLEENKNKVNDFKRG